MIKTGTELFSRRVLNKADINVEIKELTFSIKNYTAKTGLDLSTNIINNFCNVLDISHEELMSKTRKDRVVRARQMICWSLRYMTSMSLHEIGAIINKDHATVLHASRKIMNELSDEGYGVKETKDVMKSIIINIKSELNYRSLKNDDVSEALYRKALLIVNRYLTQSYING